VGAYNQLYSSNKFDSNIKNKKQNTETVSNTRRDKPVNNLTASAFMPEIDYTSFPVTSP